MVLILPIDDDIFSPFKKNVLRVSDNTEVYKSDHLPELRQNSHLTREGNSVSCQNNLVKCWLNKAHCGLL